MRLQGESYVPVRQIEAVVRLLIRLWLIFLLFIKILLTRKYPLRGYILGVLTHTTALDRHWEVMKHWIMF